MKCSLKEMFGQKPFASVILPMYFQEGGIIDLDGVYYKAIAVIHKAYPLGHIFDANEPDALVIVTEVPNLF